MKAPDERSPSEILKAAERKLLDEARARGEQDLFDGPTASEQDRTLARDNYKRHVDDSPLRNGGT